MNLSTAIQLEALEVVWAMSDAGQSLEGDEIALHQPKFTEQGKRRCPRIGFSVNEKDFSKCVELCA